MEQWRKRSNFISLGNALLVLWLICTACGIGNQQSPITQTTDEEQNDPAFQYIQEANFLEPLPEKLVMDAQSSTKQTAEETKNNIQLPPINPLEVKGDIAITSSSRLKELNELMYQRFVQQGYGDTITFNSLGSDFDIKIFCQGEEFDILTTTRPLQPSEIETCQDNGRQLVEFPVGKDALVVVVNRLDTFAKNVTLPQLKTLLSGQKWSEVNSKWPNKPIKSFLIGPQSPQMNMVVEKIFAGDSQAILNSRNTNFYQFPSPLIQDLSTTRYGIGLLDYPAYQSASRSLKILLVEGVAANSQTLQNGSYPLSRTLFIYTDRKVLKDKPQVNAFINFYLTYIDKEIEKVNYFPLSQQELNNSKSNWLKIMKLK